MHFDCIGFMKKKQSRFSNFFWPIIFGSLVFSCGKNENNNPLLGNWYGFEQDSTYYELYINDTLIVLNHENIGPIGYDYSIQEKILIVSNAAGMERIWQMTEIDKEYFIIRDSLESITYYRMDLPLDFFDSIKDSLNYANFKEAYNTRIEGRKVKNEIP